MSSLHKEIRSISFPSVCEGVLYMESVKLHLCLESEQSKEEKICGWVYCQKRGSAINTDFVITEGWRHFVAFFGDTLL